MRLKKLKKGFERLTKEKARIIAHLIGDGYLGKSKHDYNLKYEVSDVESLNSFESDIAKTYGLKMTHGMNPSGKTGKLIPFVRLRSKLVYDDLLRYASYYSASWNLTNTVINSDKCIQKEFLKAFFDDEGSVFLQNTGPIIRLYSINLHGLQQINKMLLVFGIRTKLVGGFGFKRNVYALVINDLKQFYDKLGFNLKRKQEKLIGFL